MMKIQGFGVNPERVCRTCFSMDNPLADIFSVSFNGENLVQLLQNHLSINIITDDELPRNICGNCICELHRIHAFITKCKTSQDKIKNLFRKVTEDVEVKNEEIVIKEANDKQITNHEIMTDKPDTPQTDINKDSERINNELKVKSLYEKLIDEIKSQIVEEEPGIDMEAVEENPEDLIELNLNSDNEEVDQDKYVKPKPVPEQGPPYKCYCEMSFDSLSDIEEHRLKFGHKTDSYLCEICNDGKIYSFQECSNHILGHFRERSYRCEKCERSFTRISALTAHWNLHSEYWCDICKNDFTTARKLKIHKKLQHHIGKECKCCSETITEECFKTHKLISRKVCPSYKRNTRKSKYCLSEPSKKSHSTNEHKITSSVTL